MWVNNGTYRRTEFRFEKFVNGVQEFTGGFPITVSLLNPFAEFPALTEEDFSRMDDNQYQSRLNAFYQYLSLQYPFFNSSMIPDPQNGSINSNGEDLDACPIDLSPIFMPYIQLKVDYFQMGDGIEAQIWAESVDRSGNPIAVSSDVDVNYILKEAGPGASALWELIPGELKTATLLSGQSHTLLVPRFRFRGTETDILLKSVFVQLFSESENAEYKLVEPQKISLTLIPSAFLTNFISSLQSSVQPAITEAQVIELINAKMGEITTGKGTLKFSFLPNVPQRPVLVYPADWGPLSEITYFEGFYLDILRAGAFQGPFEMTLNVDGASSNYLIYSAKNMIIYPKKADYLFKFNGA